MIVVKDGIYYQKGTNLVMKVFGRHFNAFYKYTSYMLLPSHYVGVLVEHFLFKCTQIIPKNEMIPG